MKYIKLIAAVLVATSVLAAGPISTAVEQKESKNIFVNIKQYCINCVQSLKNKTISKNQKKKSGPAKVFDITGSFDITKSNKKLKIGGTEIAEIEIEAGDKEHKEHLVFYDKQGRKITPNPPLFRHRFYNEDPTKFSILGFQVKERRIYTSRDREYYILKQEPSNIFFDGKEIRAIMIVRKSLRQNAPCILTQWSIIFHNAEYSKPDSLEFMENLGCWNYMLPFIYRTQLIS